MDEHPDARAMELESEPRIRVVPRLIRHGDDNPPVMEAKSNVLPLHRRMIQVLETNAARVHFERFLLKMETPSVANLRLWCRCDELVNDPTLLLTSPQKLQALMAHYLPSGGEVSSILLEQNVTVSDHVRELGDASKLAHFSTEEIVNRLLELQRVCQPALCADFQWYENSSFYSTNSPLPQSSSPSSSSSNAQDSSSTVSEPYSSLPTARLLGIDKKSTRQRRLRIKERLSKKYHSLDGAIAPVSVENRPPSPPSLVSAAAAEADTRMMAPRALSLSEIPDSYILTQHDTSNVFQAMEVSSAQQRYVQPRFPSSSPVTPATTSGAAHALPAVRVRSEEEIAPPQHHSIASFDEYLSRLDCEFFVDLHLEEPAAVNSSSSSTTSSTVTSDTKVTPQLQWKEYYMVISTLQVNVFSSQNDSKRSGAQPVVTFLLPESRLMRTQDLLFQVDFPPSRASLQALSYLFGSAFKQQVQRESFQRCYFRVSKRNEPDVHSHTQHVLHYTMLLLGACKLASACQTGNMGAVQKYLHKDNTDMLAMSIKLLRVLVRQKLAENGGNSDKATEASAKNDHHRLLCAPVHHAAETNNAELLSYLLENKANANVLNSRGLAPIHIAVRKSFLEVLTVLANHRDIDMNLSDGAGRMPLHSVVEPAFVQLLVDKKADIQAVSRNSERYTALHTVKDARLARALLDAGVNIHAENRDGEAALHVASVFGRIEVVRVLLDAKANVEHDAGMAGGTPLYHAAMQGSLAAVQLLLEHGAKAYAVNSSLSGSLRTPLMIAVYLGHSECAKAVLVSSTAGINLQDSEGMTALHYCARMGNVEVIRAILALNDDQAEVVQLDLMDRMDYTPLNYAWAGKHPDCEAANEKGDCQCFEDCADALIAAGATRRVLTTDASHHFSSTRTIAYAKPERDVAGRILTTPRLLAATAQELIDALTHDKVQNKKAAVVFLTFYQRFMTKMELLTMLKRRLMHHVGDRVVMLRVCNFFLLWLQTRIHDFQLDADMDDAQMREEEVFLEECGMFVRQDSIRKLLEPLVKNFPVSFAVRGADASVFASAKMMQGTGGDDNTPRDESQIEMISSSPSVPSAVASAASSGSADFGPDSLLAQQSQSSVRVSIFQALQDQKLLPHQQQQAQQVTIVEEETMADPNDTGEAALSLDTYLRASASKNTVSVLFPPEHTAPPAPEGSSGDDRTRLFDVNSYLGDLLRFPPEREAFLLFGKKCFNEENIRFYVDVLRFKSAVEDKAGDVASLANLVIDRYLTSGARFEVPFRKQAVAKMKAKIAEGKCEVGLFDTPLRESATIIRLDIFPKYVLYWYASAASSKVSADETSDAEAENKEEEKTEDGQTLMEKLMEHGPKRVAGEFARIASGLLVKIEETELLGKAWTKPNKHILAPNVRRMIQNFNKVHDLVTTEIVSERDKIKRAQVLKFFIEVAHESFASFHDYDSMLAIVSAFDSAAVHRLKPTWHALGKKGQERYLLLKKKLSATDEAGIRDRHAAAIRDSIPMVPFLALVLKDLYKEEDSMPDVLPSMDYFRALDLDFPGEKEEGEAKASTSSNTAQQREGKPLELIHVDKLWRIFDRVQDMKTYQLNVIRAERRGGEDIDLEARELLLALMARALYDEQTYFLSQQILPKKQRGASASTSKPPRPSVVISRSSRALVSPPSSQARLAGRSPFARTNSSSSFASATSPLAISNRRLANDTPSRKRSSPLLNPLSLPFTPAEDIPFSLPQQSVLGGSVTPKHKQQHTPSSRN